MGGLGEVSIYFHCLKYISFEGVLDIYI